MEGSLKHVLVFSKRICQSFCELSRFLLENFENKGRVNFSEYDVGFTAHPKALSL